MNMNLAWQILGVYITCVCLWSLAEVDSRFHSSCSRKLFSTMACIHFLRLSAFALCLLLVGFVKADGEADDTGHYPRLSRDDSSRLLRRNVLLEARQCACMYSKPQINH